MTRATRPDAQAFDEVRIRTHPRWKESEISGDEWRISGHIEFFIKGKRIGSSSYRNVETALRYGDWAVVDMYENGRNGGAVHHDLTDLCDQEGCSRRWTQMFKVKKRYRNDGSVDDRFSRHGEEHRCFCSKHCFRGDCGIDDAEDNYELIKERKTTKFYLAARYSRHVELQGYAKTLREMGYEVTSRWIEGSHQADEGTNPEERIRLGREDVDDLMAADAIINFTERPRQPSTSRGGRHVEFGMALAASKKCIVVGHLENVFHCLPEVEFYQSFDAAIPRLGEMP